MFTPEQQIAILKLVDNVIKSDGEIKIEEANFLEEMIDSLSFDIKNLGQIDKLSKKTAIETAGKMSPSQKETLLKYLSALIESDNEVSDAEQKTLNKIKSLIIDEA